MHWRINLEASPYLSEDLLIEILARLPVQSLLRLRSVCKSWKSMIGSPEFRSLHLSTNRHSSKILLTAHERGQIRFGTPKERHFLLNNDENLPSDPSCLTPFDVPFQYPDWTSHQIVGSINGLICISQSQTFFPDPDDDPANVPIVLWNPTIQRCVFLPDPTFSLEHNVSIEIGYAATTDDYKIVVVRKVGETTALEFHIYSLNSNAWRGGFEMCPPAARVSNEDRRIFHSTGAFLGGKMHWLVRNEHEIEGGYYEMKECMDTLYTFDVADEVFAEVGLPEEVMAHYTVRYAVPHVAVVGDLLHVVHIVRKHLTIWVKMEDAGSCDVYWKKLYRVDHVSAMFVCFLKNGELLMDKYPTCPTTGPVGQGHGPLAAYDPRDGKFKDLEPLSLSQQRDFGIVDSRNHQQSLVLLDRT
ncbi:F-box and associated interaction domains-containing protein [Striga asiatica]|uniref:F-box and associated interaction domains-containing protein n=1 Tax=Striga asiatica TaxID=4170 RepID=A0A5A7R2R1_STRAF|nr:F-box and associated interaction domains-containing protein [Striga asiatica]